MSENVFQNFSEAARRANRTARDLYLAGLGAISRAQGESREALDELVREGEALDKKARAEIADTVRDLQKNVKGRVSSARQRTDREWTKLEQVFEQRVSAAIARMGIPARSDLRELTARVDALTAKVRELRSRNTA